ncbi:hypothetical protein [Microbispora triticiradicis]|uniref:hypothetical protein n=1 Tax=Microbispora triticiradicis TaxID=2200763 RepID=UPI001AD66A31|nr:hypothetical protein [Microbispora triticiradicis]MBO4275770.1 hypothetical protein [Microbispora triticiradicis]
MNGRRSWWPILVAVAVVAALAVAVSMVGHVLDPGDKVNRGDLASFVVAALALAAPVVLWARRKATPASPVGEETVTAAKTTLTNLVAEQWRTEATIRSLGDPEPIPVSWHLTDDLGLMDHPRLIGHQPLTFTATSDRIPRLAENFRALHRRRLVITGGPGSGKTTLAVQLLLHLADDRRPEEPVPVLFTIPSPRRPPPATCVPACLHAPATTGHPSWRRWRTPTGRAWPRWPPPRSGCG